MSLVSSMSLASSLSPLPDHRDSQVRPAAEPPLRSDVTLIELGDDAVGLAVRERSGYRFFTAVPTLEAMDNRVFASLKTLRLAAAEGHRAGRIRPGTMPRGALAA